MALTFVNGALGGVLPVYLLFDFQLKIIFCRYILCAVCRHRSHMCAISRGLCKRICIGIKIDCWLLLLKFVVAGCFFVVSVVLAHRTVRPLLMCSHYAMSLFNILHTLIADT